MRRRGVDYTAYPPITGRRKSATTMLSGKNEKIVVTNNNSLIINGVNKNVVLDRKKTVCKVLSCFPCYLYFNFICITKSVLMTIHPKNSLVQHRMIKVEENATSVNF